MAALLMMTAALASCAGEDAPTRVGAPRNAGRLALAFRTAAGAPSAPVLGPVDTIRVALLDGFADPVTPEAVVPIGRNQTTFQVSLEAPALASLEAVAAATGTRPVAGALLGSLVGRGILYRASESGIVVAPGAETNATLTFTPFVTAFAGSTIDDDQSTHLVWWSDVPGANAWRVSRRLAGVILPDTTVTDTMLFAVGLPVAYQVRAIDAQGRFGAPSDILTLVPVLPETPSGFTIDLILSPDRADISLRWNRTELEVHGFEIERSVDQGGYLSWRSVSSTTTSAGESVDDGFQYDYRIRSRLDQAHSPWAPPVGVKVPLSAPSRLRGTPGRASVLIQWDEHSRSETAIELERRVSDTGPYQTLARLDPDSKEFTDDKPPAGAPIQYRVRAVRGTQVSAWTGPITVGLTP